MKQILTALLMLCSINAQSQDTLCVMITLDEVIHFDYQTSEVIERKEHDIFGETEIIIEKGDVLCLHFYDNKKRYRDVVTTWKNGDHRHDTFFSKNNVIFSPLSDTDITVDISRPRRKK